MINKQNVLQNVKKLISKIPTESRDALAVAISKNTSIVELELLGYPQRYVNSLEEYGILTIEQLMNTSPEILLGVPQFGDTALIRLYECLIKFVDLNKITKNLKQKVVVKQSTVSMQ